LTQALCWLSPLDPDAGVWEFHAVADPEYRGKWITPRVVAAMVDSAIGAGIRQVVAQNTSPFIARLWRKMGATVYDKISIMNLE